MNEISIIYINSSIPLNEMERLFGTSWFVYSGTLYGITPTSVIGTIMNLIAYLVLSKRSFQTVVFFKYLRLNALNSLIVCLILMTRFLTTIYKFDFTNTYASIFYNNYFYSPVLSVFYLYGNFLDIIIILERILNVHPIEKWKKIVNSKYSCLILFIFSILISIPYFWSGYPCYVNIMLNNSTLIRNYYTKPTDFSQSNFGQVLAFALFFIRDVLTLVIKLILNCFSVYLVKNYLKRKKNKLANLETNGSYINKVNRNQLYIAIVMSVLSSFENISFIVSYTFLIISVNHFSRMLYFLSNLVILVKHSSNLIIYFYNNLFKKEFLNIFWSILKIRLRFLTS